MGLDIHVMPLWQWWAADFESPLEQLLGPVPISVIRAFDPVRIRWWRGRSLEGDLQGRIAAVIGRDASWSRRRGVHLSERSDYDLLRWLQAFAADAEYPLPGYYRDEPFQFDGEPEEHPSLRRIQSGNSTRFPHLIHHAVHQGFWVPVDFEAPLDTLAVSDVSIGSSHRLAAELRELEPEVAQRGPVIVKQVHELLTDCARLSLQHRVPVILDG